jgi:hypothetical protein
VSDAVRKAVKKQGLDKYANVVGYSNQLMPKIRNNVETGEKSVRIYVSRKLPESQLKPSDVIPKKIQVEGLGEVSTDVVEIGRVRKKQLLDPKERWRPSPAGVSTGRADENSAGTLGWFMVDENGVIYAISNNHVWAKENLGSAGDPLVQPGRLDGGDPDKDALLTLHSFVPLRFTGENKVDLALASFNMSNMYVSILNIGGVVGKRDPIYGEVVRKMGRSTSITDGTVIDPSATLYVEYDSGNALFTDVFLVRGQNKPGDSGSPVLTSTNEFAGLLFAGNDADDIYVACKASNIESLASSQLGRRAYVLTVNSYPPFFREREVQVVYQNIMPSLLMFTVGLVATVSIVNSISDLYKNI